MEKEEEPLSEKVFGLNKDFLAKGDVAEAVKKLKEEIVLCNVDCDIIEKIDKIFGEVK